MPARARREFPQAVRKAALVRAGGHCEADLPSGERCPCSLRPGFYRFDHIVPDAIGGAPTLANCQVICVGCDSAKYAVDRPVIDRTRRIQERHEGTAAPVRRPMNAGRLSPVKRTLGGVLVDRATGAILSRPASIDIRSL